MNNGNIIRCTFESKNFGDIRVIYDNNEVYFSARDVGSAFGFREPTKCVSKYCNAIHRYRHETSGGMQTLNFIDYMDVIHLYKYSKEENANDLLAYLARICIALKEADMTVPELLPEESGYFNDEFIDDDGCNESDDYDYCDDCDCYDNCCCDGDCDSCDECFDCDEADEYEAPVFNVEKVLDEIGDMVRSFEEKYGILIAVEGIYSEFPSGERHRVA